MSAAHSAAHKPLMCFSSCASSDPLYPWDDAHRACHPKGGTGMGAVLRPRRLAVVNVSLDYPSRCRSR
jgi:hypothetical protein